MSGAGEGGRFPEDPGAVGAGATVAGPAADEAPPSRWLVVTLRLPVDPDLRERVVDGLLEGAAGEVPPRGVEERDEGLVVYLPPPPDGLEALVPRLVAGLGAAGIALDPAAIDLGWQPHEAWADRWRQGFETRRISPRITVTPRWIPAEAPEGGVVVVVEPGLAFGTAEHPTTRGCLRLLDPRIRGGERIADVGAGSGILAVAAALLGAARVLAVELDPWACNAARENAALNGVEARVEVRSRAVGPEFLPGEAPFDGLVANIEAPILHPLLTGFARGLRPGGWLILSGVLTHQAPEMVVRAAQSGFRLEAEDGEGEWWSGAFMREPDAGDPGRPGS